MWSDASTTAMWTQLAASAGTTLALVIPAILTVLAGLMGVGFGVRKVKKYVMGKKF
jgi:hypothetical protein